jgi:hypothetical protein
MSPISRRTVLRGTGATVVSYAVVSRVGLEHLGAETQGPRLSDPANQPLFSEIVPNALDPSFIYDTSAGRIDVGVRPAWHETGLIGSDGRRKRTRIFAYGNNGQYTWPGRTFVERRGESLKVRW